MTNDHMKDRLYVCPVESVDKFVFDERVAEVFPDMIQRSVPGYGITIDMISLLASRYVVAGTNCYDLGCSLGAAALAIRMGAGQRAGRIIAVDNSVAMLSRAKGYLAGLEQSPEIDFVCADILDVGIDCASMVVLNFTLQFIPVQRRRELLQTIQRGLRPGGILVLSEKIASPSGRSQQLLTDLHHGFKMAQGYSELEVSQKRTALERVLMPERLETHKRRLRAAGFATVEVWFQCFNFVSLLAIK